MVKYGIRYTKSVFPYFFEKMDSQKDVFFKGAYYEQRVTNERSTIPLVHDLSGMQILNSKAGEMCVRPVSQLLYGFMPLPLDADSGGGRFILAYELEDPAPRKHLVNVGEPCFCPPFPVVGDVIVVRGEHANALNMVAIRKVHDKNTGHAPVEDNVGRLQEEEHLVGVVDVSYLRRRGPRSCKFEAPSQPTTALSWHSLLQIKSEMRAIRFFEGVLVEWEEGQQRL